MTNKQQTTTNYEYFIKADTSKYKGEGIAIAGKKIIAHGQNAQNVYHQAIKKAGKKDVSLAKVPQEQMLAFNLLPF